MQTEVFHVQGRQISCDIYESELNLNRREKGTIRLLTFALGALRSEILMVVGAQLWPRLARRFRELAKKPPFVPGRPPPEVIGRISFECDTARVEHEFSRLNRTDIATLVRIAPFVRHYPDAEEIRISRDGPILVRFRTPAPQTSPGDPGASVPVGLPGPITLLRKGLASVFHRWG